ncbi:MAG: tetratricopeptide repeat protein [Deltaproteobacteria bacterium]|nr:tetratricopeptide repeat protein [Deltaproteobacteria bacterium]
MKKIKAIILLLFAFQLICAGCANNPEEKRQEYLTSAQEYMQQEKYAEAAIQYQNALQIAPDDAETLIKLGEVMLSLKRVPEAYRAFDRAIKTDPTNQKAHEYHASLQLLSNNYEQAIEEATKILETDSKNLQAKEILAQGLFLSGKREEAIGIMEELIQAGVPSEPIFINAIQMYLAVGKTDQASDLISRGITAYPESSKIRFLASTMYASQNNMTQAEKWAEEAYHAAKEDISAGIVLARFYWDHDMPDLFKSHITELKSRFPDDHRPYMIDAGFAKMQGDPVTALQLASQARSLNDTTSTRYFESQILMDSGKSDEARELLTQTLKDDPDTIPARIMLARIYLDDANAGETIAVLKRLIKGIPEHPEVAFLGASAYFMQGEISKARELIESSISKNKNNASLHALLARIYFTQREYEKALVEVEGFGNAAEKSDELLYIGALASLRLGKQESSSKYVRTMKKLYADTWHSMHAETLLELAQGNTSGALKVADKALKNRPESLEALKLYTAIAPKVIGIDSTIERVAALSSTSQDPYFLLIHARLLEKAGQKDKALAMMKHAVALGSDLNELYHALAAFYVRNSMTNEALKEYESILNKNPDDLQAATMLALVYHKSNNLKDARKVYTYILEKNPTHGIAANNLAWILSESGKDSDLNRALQLAQNTKDTYPEDPRVADTLGYVFLKKGLADNALAQFSLALEKLPDSAEINYHMALALVDLERKENAIGYLKKALDTEYFNEKSQAESLLSSLQSANQ